MPRAHVADDVRELLGPRESVRVAGRATASEWQLLRVRT